MFFLFDTFECKRMEKKSCKATYLIPSGMQINYTENFAIHKVNERPFSFKYAELYC